MNTYPQFGDLLNQQLAKADRSPSWLARQLGVKASTVSRWLNDGARPGNSEQLVRIADLLGMAGEREKLLVAAGYGYVEGGRAEEGNGISLSGADSHDGRPATKAKGSLPQPVTPFLGRGMELEQLGRFLHDPSSRLVTLHGPGGIGKTRLAIEAARRVLTTRTNFADGIFFISMAEYNAPEQLSYAMAEVLGLAVNSEEAVQGQLAVYLQDKSILFILDDFGRLLDAAERVDYLLSAASQLHILATSRDRLHLPGEMLFPVLGLTYEKSSRGETGDGLPAVQLFLQSARYVISDLELNAGEMDEVIAICRQVEGMPLAIELAASWIEFLSPSEIWAEIQHSLDILTREQRGGKGEHANIRAVFESTWRRLKEEEQAVFARLSVFRGSFTKEAAQLVAGATLPLLSTLVGKSLVQLRREGRRYVIHALLRYFAEEKLRLMVQEMEEAHARHCLYYTDFLHRILPRFNSRDHEAAHSDIEVEIENIRGAWQWAISRRQVEPLATSLETLRLFYRHKYWYYEALNLFSQASDAMSAGEPSRDQAILLARLLAEKGGLWNEIAFKVGGSAPREKALALCTQSLEILEQVGASEVIAIPLGHLARIYWNMGDIDRGIEYAYRTLALHEESQNLLGMCWSIREICMFSRSRQSFQEIIDVGWRGLAIAEKFENLTVFGAIMHQVAEAYIAIGDIAQGQKLALRALDASRAASDRIEIAWSLGTLADTEQQMGDFVAARRHAEESAALFLEMGLPRARESALAQLGVISTEEGDYRRAKAYFLDALGTYYAAGSFNDSGFVFDLLYGLADVLFKEEKYAQSAQVWHNLGDLPLASSHDKARALLALEEINERMPEVASLPPRALAAVIGELLAEKKSLP